MVLILLATTWLAISGFVVPGVDGSAPNEPWTNWLTNFGHGMLNIHAI